MVVVEERDGLAVEVEQIDVDLEDEDREQVARMISRGIFDDAEDAIRSIVMEWYLRNRSEPNPFAMKP